MYGFQKTVYMSVIRTSHVFTSVRLYARWAHRHPAKVLLPNPSIATSLKQEHVINLDPVKLLKSDKSEASVKIANNKNTSQHLLPPEHFKKIKEKHEEKAKKLKEALSQKKVFDENNDVIYEKCKDNDGRISSLIVKMKSKKERQRSGMILVEGWRMIVDGLVAKCNLKYLIFSQKEDLNNLRPFLPKIGVKIYKVPYKEISLWSDVETSPGLIGIFETPTLASISRQNPFPLQIVCDNIRVPNNLGAIMRAASGMGCENILLTKGCVDVWDSKVLRSGAGAHFRLPVHSGLDWEDIDQHIHKDSSIFIADSNARLENADSSAGTDIQDYGMPVLPYYGVDFSLFKNITLIVGGETEGISEESYRFAASRNGVRLNIPLQKGVDSLNSGMATAVIAFEIKKQLLQAWTKAKLDKDKRILQGL